MYGIYIDVTSVYCCYISRQLGYQIFHIVVFTKGTFLISRAFTVVSHDHLVLRLLQSRAALEHAMSFDKMSWLLKKSVIVTILKCVLKISMFEIYCKKVKVTHLRCETPANLLRSATEEKKISPFLSGPWGLPWWSTKFLFQPMPALVRQMPRFVRNPGRVNFQL